MDGRKVQKVWIDMEDKFAAKDSKAWLFMPMVRICEKKWRQEQQDQEQELKKRWKKEHSANSRSAPTHIHIVIDSAP